ncbi:heparan-alpha-glucosaminide N-acetyltransferase domain-containing protein [Agromyces sp. MMS24-JH15]|uniref:heparan-alpha-glucosaminide N-acetyltransferase domain-containing protein n=1 Tax=Agromyces sp. MMS24-JH15 TaxID=3243765 RepID=UPI00374A17F5
MSGADPAPEEEDRVASSARVPEAEPPPAPAPAPAPAAPESRPHPAPALVAREASARVDGVDAARGIALVGMFVAHVAPAVANPWVQAAISVSDERPRLLFALTAGLGLAFISGGTRPVPRGPGGGRARLRVQIAIRAAILIALGLFIAAALHPLVFIILDVYGIAFLLMIPLLFLPPWVALGAGALLLAVTPGLAVIVSGTEWVGAARMTGWRIPVDWAFSGAYPVIEWVPVMLIGLALGRFGITRGPVLAWSAAAGAFLAVALLAPATAILDAATRAGASSFVGGSGQVADATRLALAVGESARALANVGIGVVVVAACVWLTARLAPSARRVAGIALSPFTAMGSMPFTIYTLHLIVLAGSIRIENGVLTDDSWALTAGLVFGSMAFALLWRHFIGRGPLEQLMRAATGRGRVGGRG